MEPSLQRQRKCLRFPGQAYLNEAHALEAELLEESQPPCVGVQG